MPLRLPLFAMAALVLGACAPDPPADPRPPPRDDSADAADRPARPDTARVPSDSVLVGDPPTWVAGDLSAPPPTWTTRTTHVERPVGGAPTLQAVRVARHDRHDRIVFAFSGPLPGYHVEYVDRPAHACGSGHEVFLDGDAWLLVRFTPAQAHTDDGRPTVPHRRTRYDFPVLLETALTCDFEAEVSFVLGLAAPYGYRLVELSDPSRLAVDLRRGR